MNRLSCFHRQYFVLIVLFAGFAGQLHAQKRALTAKDFDSWKSIAGSALSRDGHYLAYGVFPQEGDGVVVIRDLRSGQQWQEDAGELPPPPAPDEAADEPTPPRAVKLVFTKDDKTLVFLAYADHAAVQKAKAEKGDKKTPAHESLVIFDLGSGNAVRVADVKSFQAPERADGFVAYQKYGPAPAGKATAADSTDEDSELEDQARNGARGSAGANAEFGSVLVLRTLGDGSERDFADVLEYQLAKNGSTLAYSVASPKAETDGVFDVATTGGEPHALVNGKGRYQHLVWNDKVDALAFVGNPGGEPDAKPGSKKAPYKLYLWKAGEAQAMEVVTEASAGFREGFVINDHAALTFSKDGERLFFGAAPPAPPAHPATIDEDKAQFDLWNYKDDRIPPEQKVRATSELNH